MKKALKGVRRGCTGPSLRGTSLAFPGTLSWSGRGGALANQSGGRACVQLPWNHSETHGLPFFSVSCFKKLRAELCLFNSTHL